MRRSYARKGYFVLLSIIPKFLQSRANGTISMVLPVAELQFALGYAEIQVMARQNRLRGNCINAQDEVGRTTWEGVAARRDALGPPLPLSQHDVDRFNGDGAA
jgi:hypothetical protein